MLAEVTVIEDPAIRTTVWANKADAIVETYYVPDYVIRIARGTKATTIVVAI